MGYFHGDLNNKKDPALEGRALQIKALKGGKPLVCPSNKKTSVAAVPKQRGGGTKKQRDGEWPGHGVWILLSMC